MWTLEQERVFRESLFNKVIESESLQVHEIRFSNACMSF
jgi:hypothetical protein